MESSIFEDVVAGLKHRPKRLDVKYNYDERGSLLFEEICALPSYYITSLESDILQRRIGEITALVPDNIAVIEYGSGNSRKTQILLDNVPQIKAYVPIDISKEILLRSAEEIAQRHPALILAPVCADYEQEIEWPGAIAAFTNRVFFYPGSTIGNRHPEDATAFLRHMRMMSGHGDGLLIGVDLKKDRAILEAAYDDPGGVHNSFDLNGLAYLNRELGADFRLDQFRHGAAYNEERGHVEMFIVSLCEQTVHVNGLAFGFEAGERIHRAYAYKYTIAEFQGVAAAAGWRLRQAWTDDRGWFGVLYFVAEPLD